jgi:hypothetical protein
MNFHRTYSQLGDFLRWIESASLNTSPVDTDIRFSFLKSGVAARVLFGLRFFGLSQEAGLNQFRSNRFFLDSLGVLLMPSEADLNHARDILADVSRNHGLNKSWDALLDNFIDLELALFTQICSSKALEDHSMPPITKDQLCFLDEHGYLIIENAIPLEICDYANQRLAALANFEAASRTGGYVYGSGRMQRVYGLLGKDQVFRDLLLHPLCHQVMSHMFSRPTFHDKYYLTSFHGNILKPGAEAQIWHVDANVPEPLPPWIIRANSNYVVQDITLSNGATEIVLGSHKLLRKPTSLEAENHQLKTLKLCAPKGSIIFWHGHLWHRSGANNAKTDRPALLGAYSSSVFREVCMEENPYLYLSANDSDAISPVLKRLLGWEHGRKNYS